MTDESRESLIALPPRELPHLAPLLRDPPPGIRLRHPHGAGAARAFGRVHNDDLHPRAQQRRARGEEPARPPRTTARGVSVRGGGADGGLVVACLGYIDSPVMLP